MTGRAATLGIASGVVGPVAFITAWAALGSMQPNYSPIADPISRLAAIDAPTSVAMTGGFLAFAAGALLCARELRVALPGPTALTAALAGIASIGIAATPLGSALGGTQHAISAGVAYAAIATTPILGGRILGHQGRRRASMVSIAIGIASAVSLISSTLASPWAGLLQRLGLTLGDAWIIGAAWHILPRPNADTFSAARPPPGPWGTKAPSRTGTVRPSLFRQSLATLADEPHPLAHTDRGRPRLSCTSPRR